MLSKASEYTPTWQEERTACIVWQGLLKMPEVCPFRKYFHLQTHQILWSVLYRLRPDNTYLLLDDFGENGTEDTGLTTELGVMSNEEEEHRGQQVRSGYLCACCNP